MGCAFLVFVDSFLAPFFSQEKPWNEQVVSGLLYWSLQLEKAGKNAKAKYSLNFSSSNRDKPVKPSLSPKKLTNHKREHRGKSSFPNNLETKLIFTEDGHIIKSENTGPLASPKVAVHLSLQ